MRNLAVDLLGLRRVGFLDELGRHPTPYLVVAYLRTFKNQCSGCHDGTFAYVSAIQKRCSHSDKCVVVHVCTVDSHVMPHGHVVAESDGRFLVQRMQNRAVLNVTVLADVNPIDVTSEHSVKPDAGAFPDSDLTHDGSVLCHPYAICYLRRKSSY